jgi:hypothetical protein
MQQGVAVCASHSSRQSVGTCSRCGRFCCQACASATPCLECQVILRQATGPLSPALDVVLGIAAALYAVCTVLMVPALAQLDFTKFNAQMLTSTPMLLFLALETVYSIIFTVLMVVFLVWYVALLDWGRRRGAPVPSTGVAFACWFVPGLNLVHPFKTIRTIQRTTSVKAPVGWWWWLTWLSVGLSLVGSVRLARGGYDVVFSVAAGLEVVAVYLCWVVVRAFRLADQQWNPALRQAAREAQKVSTSAAPF